jgi:hypothetical protein
MAFILKSDGVYIVSGPRRNRREGCTVSYDKADAVQFKTPEAARAYIAAIRIEQRAWGWPGYKLARGVVCNA